jgi:uncharacterized membrane protein YhaH (DUF805 family)
MFKAAFSFEGRIRRTEFGVSYIIYIVLAFVLNAIIGFGGAFLFMVLLAYILLIWFLIAQGAKRCHDRGNSGWFQLIPFYIFWMLFADSDYGLNEFGENPKDIGNESLINQIGIDS